MTVGGHALVALSSLFMTGAFYASVMPKGWVLKLMDREPVVFMSILVGCTGITMPLVVVPIRRSLGYDTSQYDGHSKKP